jgi:hypothetical protein
VNVKLRFAYTRINIKWKKIQKCSGNESGFSANNQAYWFRFNFGKQQGPGGELDIGDTCDGGAKLRRQNAGFNSTYMANSTKTSANNHLLRIQLIQHFILQFLFVTSTTIEIVFFNIIVIGQNMRIINLVGFLLAQDSQYL